MSGYRQVIKPPDNADVVDGKDIHAQWQVHVGRCAGAARDRPEPGRIYRLIHIVSESGLIYRWEVFPRLTVFGW